MLTPKEIDKLLRKPHLSQWDNFQVLMTIQALYQANENQVELLTQALDELDRLRDRVKFYRNTTTKLV